MSQAVFSLERVQKTWSWMNEEGKEKNSTADLLSVDKAYKATCWPTPGMKGDPLKALGSQHRGPWFLSLQYPTAGFPVAHHRVPRTPLQGSQKCRWIQEFQVPNGALAETYFSVKYVAIETHSIIFTPLSCTAGQVIVPLQVHSTNWEKNPVLSIPPYIHHIFTSPNEKALAFFSFCFLLLLFGLFFFYLPILPNWKAFLSISPHARSFISPKELSISDICQEQWVYFQIHWGIRWWNTSQSIQWDGQTIVSKPLMDFLLQILGAGKLLSEFNSL